MALPFFSAANVQDTHIVLPRFYAVCSLDEYCGCLETQRELSHNPLNVVSKELLIV